MKKLALGVVGVLVLIAVLKSVGGDSSHTITGSITLTDTSSDTSDICNPTGGYDDISDGAQVVVTDEAGKILATSTLDKGIGTSQYVPGKYYGYGLSGDSSYSGRCTHTFTVKVGKAKFYSVTVGHRKAPAYSYDELEDNGWTVGLSIG